MIAAAGMAGSAMAAGSIGSSLDSMQSVDTMARGTVGGTISVDLNNVESWDAEGSPNNFTMTVNIGAGNSLVAIGWDVEVATVGPSWLSEATMSFSNTTGPAGLFLSVGAGNDAPGTMLFSSGGLLDLTDNMIPNITADADGLITIEFFESYDDVIDEIDAFLNGKITLGIDVPAPGTAALFGFGGLAATRRLR